MDPSPFLDGDCTKGLCLMAFLVGYFIMFALLGENKD